MRKHRSSGSRARVRFSDAIHVAALIVAATPSSALAYVDPGYGMLIWQIVSAAALGLAFKVYRMIGRIRRSERKQPEDDQRAPE